MSEDTGQNIIPRSKSATQDYQLVHAMYRLDARPKMLLLLAVSHVDPTRGPRDQNRRVTISAKEWNETFPGGKNPYRDLLAASEGLVGKRVWMRSGGWRHWVSGADPDEGGGSVTIVLDSDLMPFLCAPGGLVEFSTIHLVHISGLRHFAALRLYELLNQFRASGVRQIHLEELREALSGKDTYPDYVNFRRKVLDKAVAEINDKTNLTVKWEPIKKGRSVVTIKFLIVESKQRDLF